MDKNIFDFLANSNLSSKNRLKTQNGLEEVCLQQVLLIKISIESVKKI